MTKASPPRTLAILAGGGSLPAMVAEAALAENRPVYGVVFEGQPRPVGMPKLAETMAFPLGAVGRILRQLQAWGVQDVVLAGNLSKPSFFNLKPDVKGLKLLMKARHYHDDQLLRAVTDFLEEAGFRVIPVADLAPRLVADVGRMGAKWGGGDEDDIRLGMEALRVVGGTLDVGQAVVVHKGVILGLEAVEGTDALIARCAALRGDLKPGERAGILVKGSKPGQTDLADLPTVGPETLAGLSRHGYKGLVVEAGRTLLLGGDEVREAVLRDKLILDVRRFGA